MQTTTKTSCARLACAAKRDVTSPLQSLTARVVDRRGPCPSAGGTEWGRGRTDDRVALWGVMCNSVVCR